MFFVLIITKEANDGFTQAVFRYDTFKEARNKFFTELAYDVVRKACSCTILNQGGSIIKQDAWDDSETV